MNLFRIAIAVLMAVAASPAAHAQCETPLAATSQFLDNLQTGPDWQPSLAVACFPPVDGIEETAIHLKQILDAKGILIDFSTLPADPAYTNANGEAKVVLSPRLRSVFLVKTETAWQFSPDTVASVPGLYRETFSGVSQAIRSVLPAAFHKPLPGGTQGWQWVLFGILIAVSLLAGRIAQGILQGQMVRVAQRLKVNVSEDFVSRMQGPLTWAAGGAVFLLGIADLQLGVRTASYLHTLAQAVLSVAIMVVFLRVVDVLTDLAVARAEKTDTKMDDQLIPLASRALKVVVWALGLLSILDNLGVDVTSLLAGVTISGLAVALAAKDTVENLFGSMMIFIDRPFQIGDYIVVGGNEGTVEEVGFRSTRLRTVLGTVVTIPNASIATARVDNWGLRQARRIRFTLGFTYDASREQIDAFCARVSELFDADERINDGHEVRFVNFGDSAIEVMVHAFSPDAGWSNELAVNHDVRMKVWAIADELGLSFAFPSQSIYVESAPSSDA
ncbi:MAG: mechanosensitive ion channel family protein [Myxococcota bacterium]|nr:mechanosensitive ion channel family protein [Myxococcota bacterium]